MSCTVRAMASGILSSGRPWSCIVHENSAPDMLSRVAVASSVACRGALRQDGIEDQTTEKQPLVSKGVILFDLIRGNALPRDESRSLILEIAEQWKSR
jgi:hypothetical protein